MTASDKLFFWLFQSQPDRILQLLEDLPADAGGYRFVAPVFKALEHRPDGLFLAPAERPDLPALILEAQMAFGDPEPVAEFLERRVRWLELQPALADPGAPPLLRTMALLLEKEERLPATTAEIRSKVAGTPLEPQIADATAAILLACFTTRPIPEICAMGGITLEDFTQSVAYREIFGLGEVRGRQAGELDMALRQLRRRCGALTPEQETQLRALPLARLEDLAEALLDFQGPDDLNAWLTRAPHQAA